MIVQALVGARPEKKKSTPKSTKTHSYSTEIYTIGIFAVNHNVIRTN